MILDIEDIRGFANIPVLKISWDKLFISNLISTNNKAISQSQNKEAQQSNCGGFVKTFIKFEEGRKTLKRKDGESQPHRKPIMKIKLKNNPTFQHYSNFVPIRQSCCEYKNDIEKQFLIASEIKEKDLKRLQVQFESEVKKNMGSLKKFRSEMNKKYNPCLSFTEKMILYTRLLCFGSETVSKFPCQTAIISILCQMDKYLNDKNITSDKISVSVEKKQQVNRKTISESMKSLYCPICFLYDCPVHASQFSESNLDFVSIRNKISKQTHIKKAIMMVDGYQNGNQQNQKCSKQCYLNCKQLNRDEKQTIMLMNRMSALSDLSKSLIQLGLQLFSYNPCKIKTLFSTSTSSSTSSSSTPSSTPSSQIACIIIYKYLQTYGNVSKLIDNKSYKSEVQLLLNESTQPILHMPTQQIEIKRKKNKAKAKNCRKKGDDEKKYLGAICKHHFLTQNSVDWQCQECVCRNRGYCIPQCLCSQQCPIMKIGCKCKKYKGHCCSTKNCPCFAQGVECIPGICGEICLEDDSCLNRQIQLGKKKKLKIGLSSIPEAGLGLFTVQQIPKDSLVTIYLGQKIDPFILQLRDELRLNNSFYNFQQLNTYLDSKFIGNKSRFINHGHQKQVNLQVRIMESLNQIWTAFYATRDIEQFEELFFNYDGDGQIARHHSQKYPFILSKNKSDIN